MLAGHFDRGGPRCMGIQERVIALGPKLTADLYFQWAGHPPVFIS